MEQSPSWEANQFSASQEIPRILLSPVVRYHIHKGLPPVLKMSQINPVHAASHYLIHFKIILPSMLGSFKWTLSLRFPHQNPIWTLPLPIRATCPAHLILLI